MMKPLLPLTVLAALGLAAPAPAPAKATEAGAKRAIVAKVRKDYAGKSENGVRVTRCRRQGARTFRCTFDMIDGPQFARRVGRATATLRGRRWRVRTYAVKRTH